MLENLPARQLPRKLTAKSFLFAAGAFAMALSWPGAALYAQDTEQSAGEEAGEGSEEAGDRVLARVNGEPILQSDLSELVAGLPPAYQSNLAQIVPVLMDRLIGLKLLASAGRSQDLDQDEGVREQVKQAEDQAIAQLYLERAIAQSVTEEAIAERYKAQTSEPALEVHARHILLQSAEEAEAVIAELNGGADFIALAKDRSIGPSAPSGGDLGFFTREQMVAPFADAAFAMEPGSHSDTPVQTQFGFHVILVEETRQAPVPALEEMEEQLRNELSQEVIDATIADLRAEADVELYGLAEDGDAQ